MNYYERHIGDYLKDTAHLSLLQHGVYARLLDVYYTHESGIPESEVLKLIGARSKDERTAVADVLAEFFQLVDGAWRQHRCDAEIERYQGKQQKAKAAADARWSASGRNADASLRGDAPSMRPHTGSNATNGADGMPRARPPSLQSPVLKKEKRATRAPLPAGRFPEFWQAWPKSPRKGGKPDCLKLWQAKNLEAEAPAILAHVKALAVTEGWTKQGGEYVPAPVTYLRGRRWDGAEAQPASQSAGTTTTGALARLEAERMTPEQKASADEARKKAMAKLNLPRRQA